MSKAKTKARRAAGATKSRPRAYSYLRFSRPEQAQGDSLRRQTAAARAYAAEHGLELDDGLTFRDLGVSAFRGANATEGALAAFTQAVDDGRVAPGSYLLVESLDRLSRDKIMKALNRFSALLERGIVVVTLQDGKAYTAESLNNIADLMLSLLVMARAHEESETKSRRIRAAWANKKERAAAGHVLTARCPAWLRVRDGKFEVIAERAAVVRRIFEMTGAGIGKANIARTFNEEEIEPFGSANGWHASYIQKILRNEAVIGRYQPMRHVFEDGRKTRVADGDVIPDYFPALISEAEFYVVKHRGTAPSGKGRAPLRNALSGLTFCAKCGGKMHYVNKGGGSKGGMYLACDNARRRRACDAASVRYEPVLRHVLKGLPEYRNYYSLTVRDGPELDDELEAVAAQVAETEAVIERLLDTLERVASPPAEKRLETNTKKLAALRAKAQELRERRAIADEDTEQPPPPLHSLVHLYDPVTQKYDPATLGLIAAHDAAEIRRVVAKVVVAKGEPVRVEPRGAE